MSCTITPVHFRFLFAPFFFIVHRPLFLLSRSFPRVFSLGLGGHRDDATNIKDAFILIFVMAGNQDHGRLRKRTLFIAVAIYPARL